MKFKIDSLDRVKGIALRYVCLGLSFLCLLLYFLLGATSSKLSPITGTVKNIHVSYQKKIGVLKLNIELINYRDTIFQQEYYIDIPAEIIWGIDKNHLLNLPLRGNDKITIYYDPNGNIRKLKSDKIGLKTYGLIINNNEIIDVNKRKYLTFKTSMLGTISFLLIIISFLSLIIDISTLSKKKKANSNISSSNEELYEKFNILKKTLQNKTVKNLSISELDDYVELSDLYWIIEKDYNKAENNYLALLSVYPQNISTLFMFSQMLISKEEFKRADVLLEKIFQLDNSYKIIFINTFKELEDQVRLLYWQNKY